MTQNHSSQQSNLMAAHASVDTLLSEIKQRLTTGCDSLSNEYNEIGKAHIGELVPCFSLLETYRQTILDQCPHQPQLYLPLVLTTLTAILQKNIEYTAHYVFLAAEPNANKTTTLNTISNTLNILELNQSPQWPRSYPAFYQQIGATNNFGLVMLVDEMFKKMRSCYIEKDKVDGEVFEKIVTIYESSDFQAPLVKFEAPKPGEESQERKNIKNVRFSLLGTGTTGEFAQLLKATQFTESGWLSRIGLFQLYQSKEARSASKVLQSGKNIFRLHQGIYDPLKIIKEWASTEIDVKKYQGSEIIDKKIPRRFIKLKFYCPAEDTFYKDPSGSEQTGNPWDESIYDLKDIIDTCTQYFNKTGHKKYTSIFEELGGDRLVLKASYYAQLLWLTDAILCPASPMSKDLNQYLQQTIGDQQAIYLPYTYFDMGIQIVKLMVLNLYTIMLQSLDDETGTDADIQKAIMRIFHNNEPLCIHGLSPTDVVRLITNQYRGTLYRQARRENLEELCYGGYIAPVIDKAHGKPYRGARYVPTEKGWQFFPPSK